MPLGFSSRPSSSSTSSFPNANSIENPAPTAERDSYACHMKLLGNCLTDFDSARYISNAPLFTDAALQSTTRLNGQMNRPFIRQYGLIAGNIANKPIDPKGKGRDLPVMDPRIFHNVSAPSSVFICGSQGSGKSHTLGCYLENCLMESDANVLPRPLTGIVFHYDKHSSDTRGAPCEAAYLSSCSDVSVRVFCAPTNIGRIKKIYGTLSNVKVQELRIDESQLTTERLFNLMAMSSVQKDSMPLYMHIVVRILRDMRIEQQKADSSFDYGLFKSKLEAEKMTDSQRNPLQQRLDTLESFMVRKQTGSSSHPVPVSTPQQQPTQSSLPSLAMGTSEHLQQLEEVLKRARLEAEAARDAAAKAQSKASKQNLRPVTKLEKKEAQVALEAVKSLQSHSAKKDAAAQQARKALSQANAQSSEMVNSKAGIEKPLNERPPTSRGNPVVQGSKTEKHTASSLEDTSDWTPKASQLTIVDLSCPCVTAEMACLLFNICLDLFLEQPAEIGRIIALDEAHKFMTDSAECQVLTESLLSTIRLQRHLGARVIISTQEPTISPKLLDLCSVTIIHRFTSPDWLASLSKHVAGASLYAPETDALQDAELTGSADEQSSRDSSTLGHMSLKGSRDMKVLFGEILGLRTGEALVFAPSAIIGVRRIGQQSPETPDHDSHKSQFNGSHGHEMLYLGSGFLKVRVRRRVTEDGGRSVMAN